MFKKGKNSGGGSKKQSGKPEGYNLPWEWDEVPNDYQTILKNDPSFIKTNYTNQGATIYKKGKYYYCRDNFHRGAGAHLEVFGKTGKHVEEADPLTGIIDFSQIDRSKTPIF